MVEISAKGMVIQTPLTPIIGGSVKINITTKIRERREEITAEVTPSPSAVK